jgi:hypothetical protein
MGAIIRLLRFLGDVWHGILDFLYPVVTAVYTDLNQADHRATLLRACGSLVTLTLSAKTVTGPILAQTALQNPDVLSTVLSIVLGVMGGTVSYLGNRRQRIKQAEITTVAAETPPCDPATLRAVIENTASEKKP